ncbi:PucR family transcriptional regulator [Streptomyces sp. NPDC058308]|uniref:PucR family transcriptional regulator n=1 Tax=Streptomyces sp. NPDC058308 TaxID=3346440 RepID=UPI0036EC9ABB
MLSPEARSLAARCEPRVNELARRMARESFEQAPGYAELPDEMKDLEVAATVRHGVRLFLRRVTDQPGGHRFFRERAAQRAEEGMPLHLLLRTHALGLYVLWQALREETRPGEEAALAEVVDVLLQSHPGVIGAVTETYLDERSALEAERQSGHGSLVRALLDGMVPPGHALWDQLGLVGPTLVLAVGFDEVPADSTVAVRRRLRRVQTTLDHAFEGDMFALLEADGGRVVVPGGRRPPEDLPGRLSKAANLPARVAVVDAAAPEAVTDAARTALEIVRITRACGIPPGLHRMDDVLLEYHLSRRNESSHRIAALLDPVADRPELIETLRTHLARQQERRATAAALGLHPNTVDNRLAKIVERTGIDLATPRGTALAIAALLLRDAENAPSADGPPVRP